MFNLNKAVQTLSRKGVAIGTATLDVAKAKDLGNKSWGYINKMQKLGYVLLGLAEYSKKCRKEYYNGESKATEQEAFKIPIVIEERKINDGKLYHVNRYFPAKDGNSNISEAKNFRDMQEFIEKFNNKVFRKSKDERKHVKERKKISQYSGVITFQSENLVPVSNRKN